MSINGVILLNKQRGVSSNKAVNKVKYAVGAEKAGHLGTLDVLGEGLLPITLGKGTRLFDYYLNKDKVYKTVFKFGQTTDTLDLEGEITQTNEVDVSWDDLAEACTCFIGKQDQMPPIYSAKKINGQKAYDLARAGVEVQLKPKNIEIYSIKVLNKIEKNVFELEVHCSSGTYIRSLCRDIASKLSTYGVMLSIQRTRCGDFTIDYSYTIEQIQNGQFKVIALDGLFPYPSITLNTHLKEKILNGVILPTTSLDLPKDLDDKVKVYSENEFLGIGEIADGKLKLSLRLI